MGTTTTMLVGIGQQEATAVQAPKKRALAVSSARLMSWKTVLVQSLGRELHALHIQQQERAFLATSHGLNYSSQRPALH